MATYRRRPRLPLLLLASGLAAALVGCAGRARPETVPQETAPEAPVPQEIPQEIPQETAPQETAPQGTNPAATVEQPSLRDLCRAGTTSDEALIDESRRYLTETFCGATLWFDGLFGGKPDIENARAVSGRVELSTLYTEADGTKLKSRLRLNYELPNLKRRFNVFVGRDDRDDVVRDREEGFAIRSSVFGVETEERWLAGLGYSPPGKWSERVDFRVGGRLSTAPEVFVQGRLRRNVFVGERSVWRLRETVFYENRDGFGSTTSADFDHVLRKTLLFHWGTVGTFSESTDGLDWRTATVLYQNLGSRSAIAWELFVRGSTDAEVGLREYGARTVYRRPLNRQWLYGELIGGYSWPREYRDEPREGSALVGLGVELLFGKTPF